jgi:hypothetical protein
MEEISLNCNKEIPSLNIKMNINDKIEVLWCEIFESSFKSSWEFTYRSLIKSINSIARRKSITPEAQEQAKSVLYMWKLLAEKEDLWDVIIDKLDAKKKCKLISKVTSHLAILCNQQIAKIIFDNYGDYWIYLVKNPNWRWNIYSRIPDDLENLYTKATSPIRRYLDFFNQRLLRAYIEGSLPPYSDYEVNEIVKNINEMLKFNWKKIVQKNFTVT